MSAVQPGLRSASEPANSSATEQVQSRGMSRAQQILLPVVGVIALAGVVLGALALSSDPSTAPLQRQVNALKAVDAAQHQQIAALQTETATLKAATASAATAGNLTALQTSVSDMSHTVSGVQGDLSTLHICLPELSQELNSLNINSSTQSLTLGDGSTDTFLTSAYMTNPTVISTNCTKFLTGH
jgi:hypothetical protein